jgi:excisionase family DNA binding protein
MSEGENMSEQHVGPEAANSVVVQPRWFTVKEVARMLGYGETKVRMLVISGDLRSLKDGRSRRILPEWVDEYVARRAAESEYGR